MVDCKHHIDGRCIKDLYGGRPHEDVCHYVCKEREPLVHLAVPIPLTMRRAAHAVKSIATAILSPSTAEAEITRRTDLCARCDQWTNGTCKLCGCNTWAKIRNQNETCPLGKWGPRTRPDFTAESAVEQVKFHIQNPPTVADLHHHWPAGFERWENVQQAHRQLIAEYLAALPPYPGGEGCGIVIAGGGRFFAGTYVLVRLLRHLGCNLPIQIWHLPGEREDWMTAAMADTGVSWHDARNLGIPFRILNGWELKSFAVKHCSFERVLLLDADSYPTRDPADLLQLDNLFFPDSADEDLHNWTRRKQTVSPWHALGIAERIEPAFESGQFVIDRRQHWDVICLADWINDHSDYFYKMFYGDKESWHLAFRSLGKEYNLPAKRWRWSKHTMVQHDLAGQEIFHHRCRGKFVLKDQASGFLSGQEGAGRRSPDFVHEDFCWQALAELEARRAGDVKKKTAAT